MVDDVVVGQRLLDQQQVEVVELLEGRQVGEAVGRVGVDLQRQVGIPLADLRITSTSWPGPIFSLMRR